LYISRLFLFPRENKYAISFKKVLFEKENNSLLQPWLRLQNGKQSGKGKGLLPVLAPLKPLF